MNEQTAAYTQTEEDFATVLSLIKRLGLCGTTPGNSRWHDITIAASGDFRTACHREPELDRTSALFYAVPASGTMLSASRLSQDDMALVLREESSARLASTYLSLVLVF